MRLHRALSRRRSAAARFRGHLEQLETRRLLTITVDDGGDVSDPNDGKTTLREAAELANSGGVDETILFTCDVTQVNLSQGDVNVGGAGHDITIDGMLDCPDRSSGMVTVNADNQFRVFNILDSNPAPQTATVILKNLNITGGADIEGGAIHNTEQLTLEHVNVFDNVAISGTPQASYGGGVFNEDGSLIVVESTFRDNLATNTQPVEQVSLGGAIASRGSGSSVLIRDSAIDANTALGSGGGLFQAGGSLVIDNSSVSGNKAGGVDDVSHVGGGLALFGGNNVSPLNVTIIDSTVSGNVLANNSVQQTTTPHGGGLYAAGNGFVSLTRVTMDANEVLGNSFGNFPVLARGGGALFAAASVTGASLDVEIKDSYVLNNSAVDDGGGFFARGSASGQLNLNVYDTTIRGNRAVGNGGAIIAEAINTAVPDRANVYIADSQIDQNGAENGTVFNSVGGRITLERSTIEANTVTTNGAGILNQALPNFPDLVQPKTEVRNSTLAGNSAGFLGGGLANYGGSVEIFQSTLSGNSAVRGGGAFLSSPLLLTEAGRSDGSTNYTNIIQSTITQNEATNGGGGIAIGSLHALGSQIVSTIIAENIDLSGQAPDVLDLSVAGPSIAANTTFSLIGIADGSGFTPGMPSSGGNFVGTSNNPLSPSLSGLVRIGGETAVHRLLAGSIAIDNGDPNVTGGLDQSGDPRVVNGRVDIGAVEFQDLPDCDYDLDGRCDCNDVDLLSAEIASGGNNLLFDHDGNGAIELDDLLSWLAEAGTRPEHVAATGGNAFLLGDANLDGVVDGQDFVIWNSNKFSQNGGYCAGDFNADGFIDGADFIIWNSNKFTSSDVVPEAGVQATFGLPGVSEDESEQRDRVRPTDKLFALLS